MKFIDEKGNEVARPPHLQDKARYFVCNKCGRKTWAHVSAQEVCLMPQPDGSTCAGNWTAPTDEGGEK